MITKTKHLAIILALAVFFIPSYATADDLDAQIDALKDQIKQNQSTANQKATEAASLQNKLAEINAQINAATAALNLTKAEITQTEQAIERANIELKNQRVALRKNIRLAQTQGDVTPLEVLASSNTLTDYFDKAQFVSNIQKKITQSLDKIKQLKRELDEKKNQLAIKRNDQQIQVDAIAEQRAQQQNLLAQTRGEEARYQSLIAENKKQLQGIYAERARRDAANGVGVSVGGSGGYPYVNDPTNQLDPWGFYKRECVSYVAWKRRAVGRAPYPNYWGNAGNWDNYAQWQTTPIPGAIAVFDPGVQGSGSVGHVAYVEKVNSNGTIDLSEYNWSPPHVYTYRSNVPYGGIKFIP